MYVQLGAQLVVSKVVGGTTAPALFTLTPEQQNAVGAFTSAGVPFCTGVAVAPHIVLTAAHCGIVPGTPFAVGADVAQPDHVAYASAVVQHPRWAGAVNDHSLVLLDRALPVVPFLMAAAPPSAGENVQGVGYGLTDPDAASNTARWWVVEPVKGGGAGWFSVEGGGQFGLCRGDSGGPALIDAGGRTAVAGTISQGAVSCTGEDLYSVPDPDWARSVVAGWKQPGATPARPVLRAAVPWAVAAVVAGLAVGFVVRRRRDRSGR